jgi:5'-deoxynucleotidase YfbR-like HD superfamily hydrolase
MPRPSQPATAINTRSGRVLDFADTRPEAIDLGDIAAGLSLAPRFGGQALRFHSVAQHAVNVSIVAAATGSPDLDLPALHHDSHEAYACDLPRPLKRLLGERYRDVTDRIDRAVATAFGFEWPEPGSPEAQTIKLADDALFVVESRKLLAGDPNLPDVDREVLDAAREIVRDDVHWDPAEAERRFRRAHVGCMRHG